MQNFSTELSVMFVLHWSTRKSNRLSNVIITTTKKRRTINENKIMLKAVINYQSLKKTYRTLIRLKAISNYQSLKKNYQTLQWGQSLKKNYLLRTAVIAFLSLFMLHSNNEYAYTQEIKAKASDVPAVLLPQTAWCSGRGQWACSFENCHSWHFIWLPGQSSGRRP